MSRKSWLAAACGIIALTASAISVPAAVASPPPAHPSATRLTAAQRATLSPLGTLPDKIEHFGDSKLKSNYSSLVVTRNRTHIDVYLTSLNPKAEKELRALGPAGTISFILATHSRQQMLSVHQKVTRDVGALAARGIHMVSWFPGVMGDGLEHIGVEHLTPAHARIIKRMFGARNIVVQNVPPRDVPVLTGRDNDSAPWNGGDNLTNVEGCTSGAGITYKGTNYMLTAAHCYTPGEPVYNAFPGKSGPKMGTEHSRDISAGGDDTALLSMPVSGLIWTGIIGHPARTSVSGSGTNPVGDTVCNEGAYSGEVCSTIVSYLPDSGGCLSVGPYAGLSGNRYECNLVEADANNAIADQKGDSGAPMIRYVSGSRNAEANVTGIVSAGAEQIPLSCNYNAQFSNICYFVVYYTAMPDILNNEYPGATLVP